MKIIHKYIFIEILPIFIISNIFFVFLLLHDKLISLADLFFARNVPGYLIIQTIIYYLPSFLIITIPTSVLLATMIGFSRLSMDSELIVLKASGASTRLIAVPTLIFGLFAFSFSLLMSTYLMPLGNKLAINNLILIAKSVSIDDLKPNQLYQDIPGMVIFVKDKDKKNNLKNVIVIDKKTSTISSAKSGKIISGDGEIIFILNDGKILSKQPDGYSAISFNNFMINIPIAIKEGIHAITERFMTLKDLIKNFDKSKIYKLEFSNRFAMPFAAIIMAVLGMSLGSFFSRAGKSFGIFIAVAFVFIYNTIFIISKNITWLNPFLTPWTANFVFTFLAFYFYKRIAK
jgi:lipopolysaccharide export system permease protein